MWIWWWRWARRCMARAQGLPTRRSCGRGTPVRKRGGGMSSERTETQSPEGIKKIALIGFAESWKTAPFDDPTVHVMGLNELHKYLPRWDYWLEIHDGETLGVTKRDLSEGEQKRHLDWLSQNHGG